MYFVGCGFAQKTDSIYAFTHPMFFYSMKCECSRFSFDDIYLSLYDTNARYIVRTIIPANFDVGHGVVITEKKGDYFKVKFCPGVCEDYEQDLVGKEFCVTKGELGTWLYNYDKKRGCYIETPLYERASSESKIISFVAPENGVAIILDVVDNWICVETIGKDGGKKGWLSPANQCGNPYGLSMGMCN